MSPFFHRARAIGVVLCCVYWTSGILSADETAAQATPKSRAPESMTRHMAEVSTLSDLQSLAQQLSMTKHIAPPPLTPVLADLSYEQYRDIQFRNGRAVWSDQAHPFWLEFFHRGFVQQDRVEVHVIERDQPMNRRNSQRIEYDPELFDFHGAAADVEITQNIGFAGFKVAGRFAEGGSGQEMLTFIGSSYFRARTGQTVYGSSARGLAVDVGMNRDEEFPHFRAFWIVEPEPDDQQVEILALLDSPSLTGAYRFRFDPAMTVASMRVQASLYFRRSPEKLAIAPLTSMWIWGDGLAPPPLDKRPSCHDADGLLVHADGNWTWRAFARLPYPSVTAQEVNNLTGFGLLQRDRNFDHYRDTGARYDERPSVWVRPRESFGKGRIELMEIPGAHEGIDNIGAYFVADAAIDPSQPLQLEYDVFFFGDTETLADCVQPRREDGHCLATCEALDVSRDKQTVNLTMRFQQKNPDFEDGSKGDDAASETRWIPAGTDRVVPEIQTVRGKVAEVEVFTSDRGYLVQLGLIPTEKAPVQVSISLSDNERTRLTETFEYLCPHEQPEFVYPAVYTRQE
ncbi:glucan biosynthesis protein [Allorhodopirellula solitaria]|uniref:Glucans biosynthesis protein G n=1 Tax=Allorhodopirellula solitaria TaxID=2527987 RepID=A0A5C5XVW5_9BACT|nr:glucan biosynthesis protein [Allorhodopirellula solitaria]TWT66609.1 Glucans biosynthesis protein G precursor [Allorhodopirellula solitaria]